MANCNATDHERRKRRPLFLFSSNAHAFIQKLCFQERKKCSWKRPKIVMLETFFFCYRHSSHANAPATLSPYSGKTTALGFFLLPLITGPSCAFAIRRGGGEVIIMMKAASRFALPPRLSNCLFARKKSPVLPLFSRQNENIAKIGIFFETHVEKSFTKRMFVFSGWIFFAASAHVTCH